MLIHQTVTGLQGWGTHWVSCTIPSKGFLATREGFWGVRSFPPLTLGQGEGLCFSVAGGRPDGVSPGQGNEVMLLSFCTSGRGSGPQTTHCLHREPLQPVWTPWAQSWKTESRASVGALELNLT